MVAGAAARRSLQRRGAPARAEARSGSSIFRAVPRARWARSAATTPKRCRRSPSGCSARPASTSSIRSACGALLRPAVREQGLRGGGRSQVGGARSGAARRQREWALADRVRHEPVRLPDAAVLRRAASRARQHRVHPRRGAAARDARAGPRAGRHPSGMQRAQDGHASTSSPRSRADAARRRRGPRRALLRLRRRQGLRPSGAQRARAAAPEGRAARRLHARLFVEPNLRDRVVRAGGVSVPLDHPARRDLRERSRRPRRRAERAS